MANTKIKIEDLKDLKLFKKWFGEIAKQAKKDKTEKKLRVWPSADKNTAIKDKFRNELKNLDLHPKNKDGYEYEIRPNKKNKTYHKGGWLYDFCLRELEILDDSNSKKIINLKKMILAMEVEMTQNDGSIRNDFHKLLQADAEYKIMVFQQRNKKRGKDKGLDLVEEMFKKLKKTADTYNSKSNSKYLLCGWSITDKEFRFSEFKTPKAT